MSATDAPALTPVELLRWTWRQLTSMRTALILLLLVALAAIPGSVVPQEQVDAARVSRWKDAHPALTPIYERLGLFHVYSSAWFSAIYLLLLISLVGCVLPRLTTYWRGLRAAPPRTPARLARLPEHRSVSVSATPEQVLSRAHGVLSRYRRTSYDDSVAAENGHLREAGNLLFHFAILVALAGFAISSVLGFRGSVVVVTKDGFANALSQYDDFQPGAAFTPSMLNPFSFVVNDFHVDYIRSAGASRGAAHEFYADLAVRRTPTSPAVTERVSVNHPLHIDGTDLFLISHGYAPVITVRDGQGNVAFSGPTVFLQDNATTLSSTGVVKAPDALPKQIGLQGFFYPSYAFTDATGPFSTFPAPDNPRISMMVYVGDLGLDSGRPQSVYVLDTKRMKRLMKSPSRPLLINLGVGQTQKLPDGLGSVSFDGLQQSVQFQVSRAPFSWLTLVGMILALIGLMGSLFIRPRRVWVRAATSDAGRTIVEVAGLDRSGNADLAAEVDRVLAAVAPKEERL